MKTTLIAIVTVSAILLNFLSITAHADEHSQKIYGNFDESQSTELNTSDLHSELNSIYKNNQELNLKLQQKDEALNRILSTLKLLDKKIEFKIRSNSSTTDSTTTTVTMADFNSHNDELIRKCDEIVDNYYSRKAQQEKSYVQSLYDNEQSDPEWERDIEDQLQNFIRSNNLNKSEFFDINCKSSVCQMRVQHKSSDASHQFKNKLRNESGWDIYSTQNKFDRATGGILTNIIFLRDRKKVQEFIWNQ